MKLGHSAARVRDSDIEHAHLPRIAHHFTSEVRDLQDKFEGKKWKCVSDGGTQVWIGTYHELVCTTRNKERAITGIKCQI